MRDGLLDAHARSIGLVLGAVAGLVLSVAGYAQAVALPGGPDVGAAAPDFALPAATRYGVLQAPVRLDDYRGQTVVVAFFPKARSKGCTVQMQTYRDRYSALFHNGRKVTVVGISVDPDTTLANWARESDFPIVFASDSAGVIGKLYGAFNSKNGLERRLLFVVGPDGRIVYTAKPFNVLAESAYADLAKAVDKATPAEQSGGA